MEKTGHKNVRQDAPGQRGLDGTQATQRNWKLYIMAFLNIVITWIIISTYFPQKHNTYLQSLDEYPVHVSTETLTFIRDAKYFMVSAYRDLREGAFVRVLSILNQDNQIPMYCIFFCAERTFTVRAAIVKFYVVHYGFQYGAADVMCPEIPSCNATHVTIATNFPGGIPDLPYLPIQNQKIREKDFPLDLTVCFSNVLGGINNNVLQFVQSMEIYKLLGVQKMVIYNASCGPEMEKVLQHYQKEDSLEIVSWPIHLYLYTDLELKFRGDVHNYGQVTVMNDCIYRNMDRSRYVLLADMEQIIVPYKHASLPELLKELQDENVDVATFLFDIHVFPTSVADDENRFDRPEWRMTPGVNILQHIYQIPVGPDDFKSTKMIVNPRAIKQTSVFDILHQYGETLHVPPTMSKVLQFSTVNVRGLGKENLTLDDRLWDFGEQLVSNINEVLRKVTFGY